MKVYTSPDPSFPDISTYSLFLAGGITNCPDWQSEMISLLEITCKDLAVYNPRRKDFPMGDPRAARKQIEWEFHRLANSDAIIFWFSEGSLNPIVLYELGKWGNSSRLPIFVGCSDSYVRKSDVIIQTELARPEVKVVFNLRDLAKRFIEAYIEQVK